MLVIEMKYSLHLHTLISEHAPVRVCIMTVSIQVAVERFIYVVFVKAPPWRPNHLQFHCDYDFFKSVVACHFHFRLLIYIERRFPIVSTA